MNQLRIYVHPRLSPQSIEQSSPCDAVRSHWLCVLYTVVYTCQSQPPRPSRLHFPPWHPCICCLQLCLYFCLANRFISTTFLNSTYMHSCTIFAFLFLASLCMTVCRSNLSVHQQMNEQRQCGTYIQWNVVVVVELQNRVHLSVTPCTVAHQAPLAMGFSRQEYWSGLPFPSPGDLPNTRDPPRYRSSISCIGKWVLHC